MWQFILIFCFIFGAASFLLRRVLAQKFHTYHELVNATFFGFFLLPSALILYAFFPGNLNVGMPNLMLLLGGSIIWPLLGITSLRANKEVDVGIFTIISNLSPFFTLTIALLFLNERLQLLQFIGIGLLIVSGILAAASQLHKHNKANQTGLFYSFLSALILGFAIAYEQFMLTRIDFGAYLIYGWGAQIVWAWILASKDIKKLPKLFSEDKRTSLTLLAWGAATGLRSVSFISALKLSGSAAIISAASNFMSVVVVISAYFFLRERQHMVHKWISACVGIAGLFLLTH